MAIAVTTPACGSFGFFICAGSADVTACETLKAAPGTGKAIYVDYLRINSTSAIAITIGEGAAAGTIDTILIGPVAFSALLTLDWAFLNGGMKLTDNCLLLIDADGAGVVNVFASGKVK